MTNQLPGRIGSILEKASADRVLDSLYGGLSANSVRAYKGAMVEFAEFIGVPTATDAVDAMLSLSQRDLQIVAARFRDDMTRRKFAPKTVNQRVATLSSVMKAARIEGLTYNVIDISGVKDVVISDVSAPDVVLVAKMLNAARSNPDHSMGLRNVAILRLIHDCALKTAEVPTIDIESVDLRRERLAVSRWGTGGIEWIDLPAPTVRAVSEWLDARGATHGPLFIGKVSGERLGNSCANGIVQKIAKSIGANCSAARLRRAGIESAINKTGGNVVAVSKFARIDVEQAGSYGDADEVTAKSVADSVAGEHS